MSGPRRTSVRGVAWTKRERSWLLMTLRAFGRLLALLWLLVRMAPLKFIVLAAAALYVVATYGTPHMRAVFTYVDLGGGQRSYVRCSYVGLEPFERWGDCPFIVWRQLGGGDDSE